MHDFAILMNFMTLSQTHIISYKCIYKQHLLNMPIQQFSPNTNINQYSDSNKKIQYTAVISKLLTVNC